MAMVPAEARGKLEPAEIFHEILVHRWYLSERRQQEVGIFETAAGEALNLNLSAAVGFRGEIVVVSGSC